MAVVAVVAVVNTLLPKTKIGEHKHYYAFQLLLITRDVDALFESALPFCRAHLHKQVLTSIFID